LYSYSVHVPIYPSTGKNTETATTKKNMKRVKTRQRYLHRASLHDVRHDDVHACVHVHIVTIFPIFTLTSFHAKLSQKNCPSSACPSPACPNSSNLHTTHSILPTRLSLGLHILHYISLGFSHWPLGITFPKFSLPNLFV